MSDMQSLLDIFSDVASGDTELVLYESDEPRAPAAIRQWAMCEEAKLQALDLADLGIVLFVETREYRRGIQVYCLPPHQTA